jgi:hypothetical protein
MRTNRECFITTVEEAFKGSRAKLREIRKHNGADADVAFPEPIFDEVLRGIVKALANAVARADAKGTVGRPTLLSLLAAHPEWTKLSAYKIYHKTGHSIDHIKKTMHRPEFIALRSSVDATPSK